MMALLSSRLCHSPRPRFYVRMSSSPFSTDPSKAGQQAFDKSASEATLPKKSMNTLLAHTGVARGDNAPMSPPLHFSTTYTRPADGIYRETDKIYTRDDNPTRVMLEQTMIELETHHDERPTVGAVSCAFASGMAGVSMFILAHQAPLTLLLPQHLYHGVPTLLESVLTGFNVAMMRVDMTNVSAVENALAEIATPQAIVWMESPTNPMCQVLDIERLCQVVNTFSTTSSTKFTTIVDSTLCPPCITQPLRIGADAVLHSGTKYLGGHSDILLGVVTTSPWTERGLEIGKSLKTVQTNVGAVAAPFDSWLMMRGLRTLHIRSERACQSALALAKFLTEQSLVTTVHYPGLISHPQHDIAARQMKNGFGGVLSIELPSEALAMAFVGALQTAQRATSLGGTETLAEHRASIEPPGRVTSPPGLVRISVGLEDVSDLMDDFTRALTIAEQVAK